MYTCGQPIGGSRALAAKCDAHPFLGGNVVRYVYGNDVVTRLHTGASLHDHHPHHYVTVLTPPNVRSEFGD